MYHVATRTRTRLLTYAICDSLAQANEQLKRYNHVWRVAVYLQDNNGNITRMPKSK